MNSSFLWNLNRRLYIVFQSFSVSDFLFWCWLILMLFLIIVQYRNICDARQEKEYISWEIMHLYVVFQSHGYVTVFDAEIHSTIPWIPPRNFSKPSDILDSGLGVILSVLYHCLLHLTLRMGKLLINCSYKPRNDLCRVSPIRAPQWSLETLLIRISKYAWLSMLQTNYWKRG